MEKPNLFRYINTEGDCEFIQAFPLKLGHSQNRLCCVNEPPAVLAFLLNALIRSSSVIHIRDTEIRSALLTS